jgi:hypothetical protein
MENENIREKIRKKEKHIPKIIPAYKIIDQVQGKGFIEDYVNDLLPVIEDDIKKVIDEAEKKNFSVTELPTTFDIPGMDNRRAQLHIYFHLIRALKKSHYFPKIKIDGTNPKTQRVFMYVKWLSSDDIELEQYMNEFIKAHSMREKTSDKIKDNQNDYKKVQKSSKKT